MVYFINMIGISLYAYSLIRNDYIVITTIIIVVGFIGDSILPNDFRYDNVGTKFVAGMDA